MRPPPLGETLLRLLLPRGERSDSIRGDLYEEYVARAATDGWKADAWYWVEALRIGVRYACFRWRRAGGRDRDAESRGPGADPRQGMSRIPGGHYPRDAPGPSWIRDLAHDLRYGLRGLRREPGWTVATLGTLALAIGATSAIFAVVYGVLLRPLPFPDPDRLVILEFEPSNQAAQSAAASWNEYLRLHYRHSISFPSYEALAGTMLGAPGVRVEGRAADDMRSVGLLQSLGVFDDAWSYDVGFGPEGGTQRLPGVLMSASLFRTLGVPPMVGRWTTEDEDVPGARGAVVLSHALWQDRFGGRQDLEGARLTVNGIPHSIVGVMPPEFGFPSEGADLWISLSQATRGAGSTNYELVGRLPPERSLTRAQGELASLRVAFPRSEGPEWEMSVGAASLREYLVWKIRPALALLFCAVATLLLIGCVNVVNLTLTRATRKEQEHGVRAALGAGPGRLARILLTESLLVSALGAILGVGLAWTIVQVLPGMTPDALPRKASIRLDGVVLAFTASVSLVVGLAVGLVPALHALRLRFGNHLPSSNRWASWGSAEGRLRDALVVVQLSLALVLLAGGVLLVRSFAAMLNEETGFDPHSVLTFETSLPRGRSTGEETAYGQTSARQAFYQELDERLAALPGVEGVGMTIYLPGDGSFHWGDIQIEGLVSAPEEEIRVEEIEVTPDYFPVLGMALREGRFLESGRIWSDAKEVVVTESLARRYLSGESALGRRIYTGENDLTGEDEWWTVVGVLADVRYRGAERDVPTLYFPYSGFRGGLDVALKVNGDPAAMAPSVQRILAEMDPDVTLYNLMPLEARLGRAVAGPRFQALLLGAFGLLSLLLSVVGIYGVMGYAVARRTREMGIRRALGAGSGRIVGRVAAHGLRLTLLGIGLGLMAVLSLTGLLESYLYGLQPNDATALTLASGLLAGASFVACMVPALRAARADPLLALRTE